MTTAPEQTGRRHDYADATLSQLEAQGAIVMNAWMSPADEQHLRAAPLTMAALEGAPAVIRIFSDVHRRGQAWNFLRALRAGLDAGAERITLLEDDLEICRGFVARVEATPVPADCAFISWFDPFLGCPRLGTYQGYMALPPKEPLPPAPGFVRRICSLFYCNQALTFTRATASRIARAYISAVWTAPHEGDVLIAQILQHENYAVHYPSLVQHVGALSLCNPGQRLEKNRISHHYAGADFDAATLGVFT